MVFHDAAGVGGPGNDHRATKGQPEARPDVPDRIFVYGTLRPGEGAWPLIEPFVVGEPEPARLAGRVFDTGLGYPALLPAGDPDDTVVGVLLTLAAPADAFVVLDEYEGEEYQRVRVLDTLGRPCWTYRWLG
jgi:gamma-glutamylcyclotransferase (GGCT)/AIG2-like uncharacterized protein YtfP